MQAPAVSKRVSSKDCVRFSSVLAIPSGDIQEERARTKTCASCHRVKELGEFYRDARCIRDGHTTICKACRRAIRRIEHRELQRGLDVVRS